MTEEYSLQNVRKSLGDLKYVIVLTFGLTAAGTCNGVLHSNKEHSRHAELIRRQNELETICKSNGALHIRDVIGNAGEDVYLEADGKRFYLYIDGKAVVQQP